MEGGDVQPNSSLEDNFGPILGLPPGTVRLRPYTERWAELYQQEADRIKATIGDLLVGIEHYGSTAIPEIHAKPIIDILAGLGHLELWRQCQTPLEAIGYDYAPHAGVPGHHIFGRGYARMYLLHLVEYGSTTWWDNLRFRNALRADRRLAREYETLKLQLAHEFSESRPAYTAAKTEFIRRVLSFDLD